MMTTKMTRTPSPLSRGAGDIGIGPIGHLLRGPDACGGSGGDERVLRIAGELVRGR